MQFTTSTHACQVRPNPSFKRPPYGGPLKSNVRPQNMHPMSRVAPWSGTTFEISARSVPRYLWQTVSIDVLLDGEDVLKTGGVLKVVGDHGARYSHQGTEHLASLTWGRASLRFFPVRLTVNGATVFDDRVPIQGWWKGLWPWALVAAALAWGLAH